MKASCVLIILCQPVRYRHAVTLTEDNAEIFKIILVCFIFYILLSFYIKEAVIFI